MGQVQEDQGKREDKKREREKQVASHPLCRAQAVHRPVREGDSPLNRRAAKVIVALRQVSPTTR